MIKLPRRKLIEGFGASLLGCGRSSSGTTPWYARPSLVEVSRLPVGSGIKETVGRIQSSTKRQRGTLVVVPGGAQNENMMIEGLRAWGSGMAKNGWEVVSPAVGYGEAPFYSDAGGTRLDRVVEKILGSFPEPVVALGISNGGIALLELLGRHPNWFSRTITSPGYLRDTQPTGTYRGCPVTMLVGERDSWAARSKATASFLKFAGAQVQHHLVPNAAHSLFDVSWFQISQLAGIR